MSKSGVNRDSVAPPSGTGQVAGMGESFNLDLNSGQCTYSIPFELPKGVAGLRPTFKLMYSHNRGNDVFGYGWQLEMRSIHRRLELGNDGSTEEYLDGNIPLRLWSDGLYHPDRETTFTRYERQGDGWLLTERSGRKQFFGMSSASRIAHPDHPDRIQTWLLEREEDVHGNAIDYHYLEQDGYKYLDRIEYAIYRLRFHYETRPDMLRDGKAGFLRTKTQRCSQLSLHLQAGDELRRELVFTYDQAPLSEVSLLVQAQLRAHHPTKPSLEKAPMTFTYELFDADSFSIRFQQSDSYNDIPPPLSDGDTALVTLDDGPLPGILQNRNGRHFYWGNDGNGGWEGGRPLGSAPFGASFTSEGVQFLDTDGNGTADMLVGLQNNPLNGYYRNNGKDGWSDFVAYPRQARNFPPFQSGNVRLGDLNSDGVIDAIYTTERGVVSFQNQGAAGWAEPTVFPATNLAELRDRFTFFTDMTGDGQPDLVRVRSGQIVYWPNLGQGRFGEQHEMANSPYLPNLALGTDRLFLLDIDGTGCADLVKIGPDGVWLYVNQSGSRFADPVHYDIIPIPMMDTISVVDMDGNRSAGLLYNTLRAGKMAYTYLHWQRSAPSMALTTVDNGIGLQSTIEYQTAVSMSLQDRAEGRLWTTHLPFPLWVVSSVASHDTLRSKHSRSTYRYHDGHYDTRFRQFQGFADVDRIEEGDASRATVRTRHQFLMNQAAQIGRTPAHAHLDRLLARVDVYELDGTPEATLPLHSELTEYDLKVLDTDTTGNSRVFIHTTNTRKVYQERTADARIEERIFTYDEDGNVVKEVFRGHGTHNGAPVTEKTVVTEVEYATNATRTQFQVARRIARDGVGTLLSESVTYYDGANFSGLPLGQLEKGLKVREEKWVLPVADFNTIYAGMDAVALGYIQHNNVDGVPSFFTKGTELVYSPQGNVIEQTNALGSHTSSVFDGNGMWSIQTEVNGKTSTTTHDPFSGKPLTTTGHNGDTVRTVYDAFDRLTHFLIANDTEANPTRLITYDDLSLPTRQRISYHISDTRRAETVQYFDGQGKEMQKRVARAANDILVSGWMEQNAWGEVYREYPNTLDTTMAFAIPNLTGLPFRQTKYDGEGRPVHTINFTGGESNVDITPFEIRTYDHSDLDSTPGNAAFNTPRIEKVDMFNQRIQILETGAGGTQVETNYNIGLQGKLLALSDAKGTMATYRYDHAGNRLQINHRDTGLREQWFDAQGNIVRTRSANGHDVNVQRDGEGRLTEVRLGNSTIETYAYDDLQAGSDGRLITATYDNGLHHFTYNARGQVSAERMEIAGQVFNFAFEYNGMGRQTALVYPNGMRVERSYYDNGMLRQIQGTIDLIEYDANNYPTRIDWANGLQTMLSYQPGRGRVVRQTTTHTDGTVLEDSEYTYDQIMRLIGQVEHAPGQATNLSYAYDPMSQLTQVTGTDPNGAVNMSYLYDDSFNMKHNPESNWSLDYNDPARPDRLTSIKTPDAATQAIQYDSNGNILNLPGSRQLEYGFKNELKRVTTPDGTVVAYDYDFRGNCVRRTETKNETTTETIFLGRLVEVHDGTTINFIEMYNQRVAIVRGALKRYLHTDQYGSVRFFSDETGTKLAQIVYYMYGNRSSQSGTPPMQVFALHRYDETTGLYNMGKRWYLPEAGRFLTPDPLYLYQPDRSDTSIASLRLYTYVGNEPTNKVDPTGLSFWSVVGAIVGVIVGIVVAIVVVAAFASGIGFGLLAIVGVIGLVTASYMVAHDNMGTGVGEFFRGFLIGLNAGMNATFLAMLGPVGAVIGVVVGVISFLSAIDSVAQNEIYQGILGWSNWLMPMSWLVTGLGLVFWILNGLGHLIFWSIPSLWGGGIQFFRIEGFRMDWTTGMLATRGGWISNLNAWDTAFNMGNFAYVDMNSTGWHMDHEAGHTLNLGAYGSIFHFVGFIHEVATGAGANAFAEQTAESNVPGTTRPSFPQWA